MEKDFVRNDSLFERSLANRFPPETRQQRLIQKGAVDLRDNLNIEDLGNGYRRFTPINPNKKFL
ncbi:hypothetical protein [Brevibacillus borstelensis]|uniref:hypothetical protein n=1 Tax=Brevibacillus borstelensis TaxID=45462 RepID=UPI0012DFBB02|nr:hypothetical protein [Brevibacillus borstelensis]MCC0567522.1 hypothetical protein [Brevibacillus borstelensis]MCM3473503.1 hypothetical protein [Brevibacillus borstelensis]MCM3561451.1 hypothetical protein [Brevibacillus borstelensis]MCM3594005.1 hypothetical protein [Brevibacillus borstelensis]MED1855127.1 hypothetical protein [Brevibacillus borstelensis]